MNCSHPNQARVPVTLLGTDEIVAWICAECLDTCDERKHEHEWVIVRRRAYGVVFRCRTCDQERERVV